MSIIRLRQYLMMVSIAGLLWVAMAPATQAVDIRQFDPGNIISDAVMRDKDAMSEQQIQNFLRWKNPCNNTNIRLAERYPHLHFTIRDGRFICMTEERFDGESAAHIIWRAAQDYRINPRVILVLLEKEQSLVTDSWPSHVQYRTATGYGCPDTADCDAAYFGLKNQIRWAAKLFNEVLDGGWSNYPVGPNFIQYHPNASCGGTTVTIKNRATSALYRYTPYQPNPAALRAGYGTGDSCSAYGNRNFWLLFRDWFGDPLSWRDTATPSTVDIPVGRQLVIRNSHGLLFDVSGSQSYNGATVIAWTDTGNKNQRFIAEKKGNLYVFRSAIDGRVLDLTASNTTNGTALQLWDYTGSCGQHWSVIRGPRDTIRLLSACDGGKAVDLNPKETPGARPIIYNRNDGLFQLFTIEDASIFAEKTIRGADVVSSRKKYALMSGKGKVLTRRADGRLATSDESASAKHAVQFKQMNDGSFIIEYREGILTLSGDAAENGSAVVVMPGNGQRCGQRWHIYKRPQGKISLVSTCNRDIAIDINPPHEVGTLAVGYQYHGKEVQHIALQEVVEPKVDPSNIATLVGRGVTIQNGRGLFLEAVGSDPRDGAWVGSWTATHHQNQRIIIEQAAGGTYVLRSVLTGKTIDAPGSVMMNGATLEWWKYHGGCNQRWYIERQPQGSHTIASACDRTKVLDLNPPSIKGTRPVLFDKHGGPVQQWRFSVES